jgi:hypothetical protein
LFVSHKYLMTEVSLCFSLDCVLHFDIIKNNREIVPE